VSTFERLEALVDNDALYELADAVPTPDPTAGGRPRMYPVYMWLLYDALLSIWGSARRVEAELAHPIVWNQLRTLISHKFPDYPDRWLPANPMRRWHYLYGRTTWLTDPAVFAKLHDIYRRCAIDQAHALGLLDPDGPGSWTRPDLARMLYADGKVVTPLFRAKPDTRILNKQTGEVRTPRFEADAGLHFEGTGETAWGLKFVLVAVRTTDRHGRIILDTDWVPSPGGEATTALDSITRIAADAPGLQGVIYDGALRGVHHQRLLRDLGLLPINKVTAAQGTGPNRKKTNKARVEKSTSSNSAPSLSPTEPSRPSTCSPVPARSASSPSPTPARSSSPSFLGFAPAARPTRSALTAGTTTTACPTTSGVASSSSDSTATTKTACASSTEPRTSELSRRVTPRSALCTHDATTPSPSTEPSTTPSGSAEPTPSAPTDSGSTS
jgi:hypothetical protein